MEIVINEFSSKYDVYKVCDKDILKVYELCVENSNYYDYMKPLVTPESIHRDMLDLLM